MPEQTVWRGTSSQWKNAGAYFIWGLASVILICISVILWRAATGGLAMIVPFLPLLLIVPLVAVVSRYLQTKSRVFELTTERLKVTEGVFSKVTDTLELYRVKDIETRQPFLQRMVGVENVQLNTSDASNPSLLLDAIPCTVSLADQIRNQVETMRQQKRVREIDIE
ncbi:MAG: PH domain-containing protein [Chthoniobacterales bacterium]